LVDAAKLLLLKITIDTANIKVDVDEVSGVTFINTKNNQLEHYMDCHTLNGSTSDLEWRKEGQLLQSTIESIWFGGKSLPTLRITGISIGDYICSDLMTGRKKLIRVISGMIYVLYRKCNTCTSVYC